ncbi:hypothetical protein ACQ4PT_037825 [Festuca glaucescens]
MAAMRRLLQQLQPVVAHHQAALRRLLHSTSPLAAASTSPPDSHSPSPSLLPCSTGLILPTSAGAVVVAARTGTVRSAGYLDEPLSLQLSGTTDWFASSSSTLLHGVGAPWAHWTTTPADDVVLMLAGANVAVYGLWRLADPKFRFSPSVIWLDMYTGGLLHKLLKSAHSYIDQRFMVNHFMISVDNFKSLRLHTLLTSAFSHIDTKHLFNNMIGLYFFGSSGKSRVSGSAHLGGALVAALVFAEIKGWI